MARLPGLFQRDSVWCLRVMIPRDLQGAFNGRSKVVLSLKTSDRREASQLGAQQRAAQLQARPSSCHPPAPLIAVADHVQRAALCLRTAQVIVPHLMVQSATTAKSSTAPVRPPLTARAGTTDSTAVVRA